MREVSIYNEIMRMKLIYSENDIDKVLGLLGRIEESFEGLGF